MGSFLKAFGLAAAMIVMSAVPHEARGFEVAEPATASDGIRMTELADPTYLSGAASCGRVASFAPNESKFVVVVRRGDLRRDIEHYTMLLWTTAGRGFGSPRTVLQMDSSSIWPAIDSSTIVWSADGRSLTFLGEQEGGHHEVFQLDITTGKLRAMTSHPTSVMAYSRDAGGSAMAYTALPPFKSLWDAKSARSGYVVTRQYLSDVTDLILGRDGYYGGRGRPAERELFVEYSGGTHEIQALRGSHFLGEIQGRDGKELLSMSPDGHHVVVVETVPYRDIPSSWARYRDWGVQMNLSYTRGLPSALRDTASVLMDRYVLVDVSTGQSRVLLDSPARPVYPVTWAPDSKSLIVSGVLLPIGDDATQIALRRASVRQAVEVNIRNGVVTPIGELCYRAKDWRADVLTCHAEPSSLSGEMGRAGNGARRRVADDGMSRGGGCPVQRLIRFRKIGDRWQALGTYAEPVRAVDVWLEESMNARPKIYARMPGDTGIKLLYDLDPQFRYRRLARVELVKWRWSRGRKITTGYVPPLESKITAGLYYPPRYQPGRRYPLVIQTHGFNPDRFEFFGPWPTAYAAQPLAARDIFVLQVPDVYYPKKFGGEWQLADARRAMKIYMSAIAYLADRGLIDRRRVGIMGFSHTCFYVKWALTHDPRLFAAASVAEGDDGGYLQYITGQVGYWNDAPSLYGGGPFGQHLKTWLRQAPAFNLDRVQTPLWINVLNPPYSVLLDWEWFEGLRDLGRPVEMVMLDAHAHEEHQVQMPWDRLVSEEGNVDWFDFWLNGHEDPNPAKAPQYRRWESLCGMQRAQNRGDPTFCMRARHQAVRSPR